MQKWLVFILLLGLMLFPAKAGAQNEIKFETLVVGLWSEFDQPSMLVINEFVLSEDTPVPAVVTMRFPKGGNLMAVAVSENGGLFNANFEGPAEQGNWQTIRINVETYNPYRVEYYQQLTRDGNKREFEYQWSGEYAVKDLTVSVLVPPDSENVVSSPLLPNLVNSPDGGITGSASKSGLTAGQSFNFKLEYARESDTVIQPEDANSVQPSEPIGSDTAGRVSIDRMPYVIGGVGVVLIVIALFFYWRSTQSNVPTQRRRKRPQSGESQGQAYCHECGARARTGDRFCRTCGSRLRTDS